ncbi:cysteine proteinase [Suillus clintonianus]|uniref:cysteine proteinase n=1 Tax=Suillus clintonianus TaxID=1904413 RepID=UPI001B87500E|nr:cysteine proteinase [Suillus clintonianus]KAG2154541.1 cysteine proteinase [Suillus clintonianus]
MNSRKRPASDSLLPMRSAKYRRTEENQGIWHRWCQLGADVFTLSYETVRLGYLSLMNSSQKPDGSQAVSQQPENPNHAGSLPSRATHSALPPRLPIPEEFHNHVDSQPMPGRSRLSSSLPSRSESSNALNGNATSPSTLTGHTSVTPVPSTSKEHIPCSQSYDFIGSSAHGRGVVGGTRPRLGRDHIYDRVHKAKVQEDRKKDREELVKDLFHYKRSTGYTSDFGAFKSLINYQARLEILERHALSPSPSLTDLRSKQTSPGRSRRHSFSDDVDPDFLERALRKAKKSFELPPPKPFSPSHDRLRLSARHRDEAIEKRLRPKLPKVLPPDADTQVNALLCKKGVISKVARESVNDRDLSRLLPSQWLNDEIMNFYGAMILTRSESSRDPTAKRKMLDVHYFSTFFWPKLKNEGYDQGRLAKWTKKIDIFSKDVILIPVNHNNSHWTGAAINFRRKRIESYDSMNLDRHGVFKALRGYLDSEHRNKRKKPFDFTGWQNHNPEDTPQQENGYDCGVFTCQFLESLSRGEEAFHFSQRDMAYLRRRMIWEIGHAKFLDGP